MGNKFEIKKSLIDGTGIFAASPIKKSELVATMKGEEISISELKRRYKKREERSSDPLQVKESRYLDLYEPYVFFNHSCDPNTTLVGYNELIAMREIETGEEITYDYSFTDWSNDKSWQGYDDWFIECKCKSPSCRKIIREFRFLPKRIQERCIEQKLVQDYIIRKYKKCHET